MAAAETAAKEAPIIPGSTPAPKTRTWNAELARAFSDPRELVARLGLDPDLAGEAGPGARAFPLRVPRGFAERMRPGDSADPLLRQILPLAAESETTPGFDDDPVGDLDSLAAPGVLYKYAGRVLLIATGACAINCRYCFRRHFPYQRESAARDGWREALRFITADPDIREVILSGGDPLVLGTHRLRQLSVGLASIPAIRRLRIHTRIPVVLPQRLDGDLLSWLGQLPMEAVVVIHCNHPRELGEAAVAGLARLHRAGVRLFNQAVLLRGVNDSARIQIDLAEALFSAGVVPYYLHLLDRVQGAAHFEVPESEAHSLYAEMRRNLSGYLLPRLVREAAGAPYKLPLL